MRSEVQAKVRSLILAELDSRRPIIRATVIQQLRDDPATPPIGDGGERDVKQLVDEEITAIQAAIVRREGEQQK
jgi:hypothetical protein